MRLFRGMPHVCNYLPGHTASSVFIDPDVPLTTPLYAQLVEHGFRRSGGFAYRPACANCTACVPVRVDVEAFTPTRSQRRTWKANQDLTAQIRPAQYSEEYFALYRRYLEARHAGSGMEQHTPEEFRSFLVHADVDVRFHEFRLGRQLIAVAVVDHLPAALSAVYTFFDPSFATRSLGTHAVLAQIHTARNLGMPWLYLGYWIGACRKMSYKSHFQPAQQFVDDSWTTMSSL